MGTIFGVLLLLIAIALIVFLLANGTFKAIKGSGALDDDDFLTNYNENKISTAKKSFENRPKIENKSSISTGQRGTRITTTPTNRVVKKEEVVVSSVEVVEEPINVIDVMIAQEIVEDTFYENKSYETESYESSYCESDEDFW